MSGVIDTVHSFFESITDSFAILPLLVMGLLFFLATLTSNIGMLYLLLGQILIVPALSFAANVPGSVIHFFFNESFMTGLKWIISAVVIFTIASISLASKVGGVGFSLYGGLLWTILFQLFNNDLTILDTYNPLLLLSLIFGGDTPPTKKDTNIPIACSLVPGMESNKWTSGNDRNSPTAWLIHICFLFGFIISNAVAVYNEPTPTIRSTANPAKLKARQDALDTRVSHRKSLSIAIGVISMFVLICLLYLRLQTPCEDSIGNVAVPILITFFLGYGWFYIIYKECGVRPTDVLGIVQGFVSPDMIDNPIVCVGSDSQ